MGGELQFRPKSGGAAYAPQRDVAHLFVPVMRQVAAWVEDGTWNELSSFMTKYSVTPEMVAEACGKMCQSIGTAAEHPTETCRESIQRTGFLDEPEESQLIVLACIGAMFVGIQHSGIREATLDGEGPLMEAKDLIAAGEKVLAVFAAAPVARKRMRLSGRLRRWFSWF